VISVVLPNACPSRRCRDFVAVVAQRDRLRCRKCRSDRGQLPDEATRFIEQVINTFGALTSPIIIRTNPSRRFGAKRGDGQRLLGAGDQTNEPNSKANTEIAKTETAYASSIDAFETYADMIWPRVIVGELLRFTKGDWIAGESNEIIPVDTAVLPVLDSLLAGYVRWEDGRPTEQVMVRVGSGRKPPKRNELGDTNQDAWEKDDSGERRDPWQFTNYLPLIRLDSASLFTFATGSAGGKTAVADLARSFASRQKFRSTDFPIVKLSTDSYAHRNRSYGRIKVPLFRLDGYVGKPRYDQLLAAAGLIDAGATTPAEQAKLLPPVEFGESDGAEIAF
jgi:hypothetical protein